MFIRFSLFFLCFLFSFVTLVKASDDYDVSRPRIAHSQKVEDLGIASSQGLEEPEDKSRFVTHVRASIVDEERQNRRGWVRTGGEILLFTGVIGATTYGVVLVFALYCAAQLSSSMSGGHADTFEIFTEFLKGFFFYATGF